MDDHASILLKIKNTRGIQKESSYSPEATVGLNRSQLVVRRTASDQEAQEQEILLFQILYNSTLLLHTTDYHGTPAYHSSLQPRSTTTAAYREKPY